MAVSADRVAVSDTLNHRIVLIDRSGGVLDVFGAGSPGLVDGPAEDARFRSPQGLVIQGETLYVADAGNHAIRVVDLKERRVSTLAGTGILGRSSRFAGEADARQIDLRSPWALALDGERLLVAMAGSHQIWWLSLANGRMGVFAGSGREGIDDGAGSVATFSQPTGLAIDGRWLFVVDAEASAIRRVNLNSAQVETLVGTGLFDFGRRDGPIDEALFQHPADLVAVDENTLVVADTYNHSLREIELAGGRVSTVTGSPTPGGSGRYGSLNEPFGLALIGADSEKPVVVVADTNNNRLVLLDLSSKRLEPLTLVWPEP